MRAVRIFRDYASPRRKRYGATRSLSVPKICRGRVGLEYVTCYLYVDVLGFRNMVVSAEDRVGCFRRQGLENFRRGSFQWKLRLGLFVRKRHATMLRAAMHPDVCDRRSIAEISVNMVFIFRGSSRALRAARYRDNFGTLCCTGSCM